MYVHLRQIRYITKTKSMQLYLKKVDFSDMTFQEEKLYRFKYLRKCQ